MKKATLTIIAIATLVSACKKETTSPEPGPTPVTYSGINGVWRSIDNSHNIEIVDSTKYRTIIGNSTSTFQIEIVGSLMLKNGTPFNEWNQRITTSPDLDTLYLRLTEASVVTNNTYIR